MRHLAFTVIVLGWFARVPAAHADVIPNPLFADHAVLQQGLAVPVWGKATPGEVVTVEIAGQTAKTTTGADGRWRVRLEAMKAGGPFTLTISGKNRILLADILVGEVWVASGQSNMERKLGPNMGVPPITDWEKEVAAAQVPQIRHFGVAQTKSFSVPETVTGRWTVCSPGTVKDFSAVAYFFSRDLFQARHVPVGIIHSSWGGTPAEAWTSEVGLRELPDFANTKEELKLLQADPKAALRKYEGELEIWMAAHDAGSAKHAWYESGLDTSTWKTMALPSLWEEAGEPDLNGVVWFRKSFELPASAAAGPAELQLGLVDDVDTTWVNGVKVGFTFGYNVPRKYSVPAGVLKAGTNVITVRVLDTGGGGGIWGEQKPRLLGKGPSPSAPVDLSGPWQYHIGMHLQDAPAPPTAHTGDVGTPTMLWNGMIAPLVPYAMRGVIWYQGEGNVQRERQYRSLFPALIADWRRAWGLGEFPFLFVQIAPFDDMTPEIREAQLLTWRHTPNTAMAVTTDCGDAKDIHPAHKQPVGARLALAARALAYGDKVEYSGPAFQSMAVSGNKATLRFDHLGGGLVAKGGPLQGFTIAGEDKVFVPARAEIRGSTVVVTSKTVAKPVAVRYGWANVPVVNLFNKAGLPASPFRTDAD
jgi:sialate O-acetylesterase